MKPELRVALLGDGFMGKAHSNAHAQAGHFFDLPYRIRRKLICGLDTPLLHSTAAAWEWEETATDWRAAIDRKDIDAIDIALPNHLHAEAAIAAAEAGKIVLCEKPLALTAEDARAMVAAAAKVPNLVWYNYRRVPAIAFARQLISDGRLGQIFHYDAAYKQQWGADTTRAATWRMDPKQAGSGVADDLLTHVIDTALFLNGRFEEAVATNVTFIPGRAIDDALVAIVKFENGSLGTIQSTRFGIGCKNQKSFRIHGAGGMLAFNLERLNYLEFLDFTQPSTEQGVRDLMVTDLKHPIFGNFWRPGHVIGYEHSFIATLAAFLEAVAKGEEFHPNFKDGLAVQEVLATLQTSAKKKEWITMKS
jgi:predicted dehydrogenase